MGLITTNLGPYDQGIIKTLEPHIIQALRHATL